ncbi:RNA polymerase sigma factor, sigma-70 family [Paenibacillaceae bacterium GAS479]|nr:RNA polymerase sigma factor, sigma-70 family [Paenibacillaceae bacterium GAS479]
MGIPEPKLYKQIFYDYYTGVLRKLTALVRDAAVAEDLAQETFLKLYRQPPDNLDAPGAWLHRVATRLAYDYMQKAARERKLTERQGQELPKDGSAAPSGEDELMRQLDQEEVRMWLDGLDERDRKALLLRYSGYSYTEIAEELNIRPPVVGTLLSRATERLRRLAGESDTGGGRHSGGKPSGKLSRESSGRSSGSDGELRELSPEPDYRVRAEFH